jgi:hypothetical protein
MPLHKGSREATGEYFDDFDDLGSKEKGGVFGGLGRDYYEGVHEELVPEGLRVRMQCRLCGVERNIVLDWEELYIAGSNGPGMTPLLPRGWSLSAANGAMHPNILCNGRCGDPRGVFAPMITPDEAAEHVRQGVLQGFIPQQHMQQWEHRVQAFRRQHG